MNQDREGFLVDITELEGKNLLQSMLKDIKLDIYNQWSETSDEKQVLQLHAELRAIDRILFKFQDYRNELTKLEEGLDDNN